MTDEREANQIVRSLGTNGFVGRIDFDPASANSPDLFSPIENESLDIYRRTYRDCSPYPPLPTIDLISCSVFEGVSDELGLWSNEDQTVHLIAVGRISNHVALRRRLEGKAHRFQSTSTLEIVLHLYEDEGLDGLEALQGRFGIAVWDQHHRRLVLASDPVGMKSLYYSHQTDRLAFATGLSPVQRMTGAGTIDLAAVDAYLTYGFVPRPLCMIRDIQRLRPGRCLVMEHDSFKVNVISPFQFPETSEPPSMEIAADSIRQSVAMAADGHACRVWSDQRLPSLLVEAAAKDAGATPLKTDLTSIRRKLKEPIADVAARMQLDEPIADLDPILLTAGCRATGFNGKLLTGFGGDEILLIHLRYAALRWMQFGDRIPDAVKNMLVRRFPVSSMLSRGHSAERRRWMQCMKALNARGARRHHRLIESWLEEERAEMYREEFLQELSDDPAGILTKAPIVGHDGIISATIVRDLSIVLPDRSLAWFDRVATGLGLCYGHPLLGREVVDAVLPLQLKDDWGWARRRRSLAIRLGAPVTARGAASGSDAEKLCREDLDELIHDLLGTPNSRVAQYLSMSVVATLIDIQRRRGGFSRQVISLLMLELCLRQL